MPKFEHFWICNKGETATFLRGTKTYGSPCNIPDLTQKILSFDDKMNAPTIGAYSELIKRLWSGEHVVTTPSSLLVNICESLPRFTRYRQHDAQEFMNYFLHLIHQELTNEQTLREGP